jgi:hypothetical protein
MTKRSDEWLGSIIAGAALFAMFILFLLVHLRPACSQENHAAGHAWYQNWVNKKGQGCCNSAHCGTLPGDRIRTRAGELEVFIEGVGQAQGQSAWCPVLPHHYLSAGNAPSWETAHVCVYAGYGGTTPCEQFICFQPQPGI